MHFFFIFLRFGFRRIGFISKYFHAIIPLYQSFNLNYFSFTLINKIKQKNRIDKNSAGAGKSYKSKTSIDLPFVVWFSRIAKPTLELSKGQKLFKIAL